MNNNQSKFDNFIYKEKNPEKNLFDFVKRFWYLQNSENKIQNYTILPDGYCDLIITIIAGKLQNITVYGIWTKELEVQIPANSIILGVCLKPLASEYILKQNLSKLLNSNTFLENDYWNINELDYENFEEIVQTLSSKMTAQLQKVKLIDNRKIEIFNYLFQNNTSLKVENLSQKIFWTSRQINRYFNSRFGLSLKSYHNILRCSATYTNIREGEFFPKDDFYDQSHFIKEIKKHTGEIPTELHKNKNDRFLQFKTLN